MWTQIAGAGLTILAPGYLLALLLHKRGEHAERSSPFELAFFAALLGILADALIAQALASFGVFSAASFFGVVAVLCVALAVFVVRGHSLLLPVTLHWHDIAPLVLLLVLAARFSPVTYYLFGSADEGIYPSAGVEIAVGGRSTFADLTVMSLSPELRQLTHVNYLQPFYSYDTAARGLCGAHGLHMMPAFFAVLYTIGGRLLMLDAPLLFAIVALAGFYVLVRRFAGPWAALIATAVLGLNPATVWFARITFAEGMSQMYLLGGFAMFATAWPTGASPQQPGSLSTRRLLAAGVLLGAVNHAKIDFFLMPWAILVATVMLLWSGFRGREARALVIGYGAMFLLAAYYALTDHRVYYTAQFFNVEMYGSKNAVLYLGGVFTPIGLTALAFILRNRLEGIARALHIRALTIVGGVVVTLAAAYLYWIPPLRVSWDVALNGLPKFPWNQMLVTWKETFWPAGSAATMSDWQRSLAAPADIYDVKNVLTFRELTMSSIGLYVTALGTMLAVVGTFVMLLRRDARSMVPFLLFFLAQTAFILLVSGQIDYGSAHPHAPGRRFLGITIPGVIAMSIVPWFLIAREVAWGRYLRDATVAVMVYIAMVSNKVAQPIYAHPLWDQTLTDMDAMYELTTPDTVLIAMLDDDIGQRYQLPLRFFSRVRALLLSDVITPEGIDQLIGALRKQGLRPVLITGEEHPDTSPAKLRAMELLDPLGHTTYRVTENTITYQRFHFPRHEDFGPWRPVIEFHGLPGH